MKRNRVNNHEQSEVSASPFPLLPVQMHPGTQSRLANPVPLIIGMIVGAGLIAFLIFAVPWGLVSQTLTGSFHSLSTQVKQVQFAQVKQPEKASVPSEVSTPPTSTVETAPAPEVSAPATSAVETTPIPEVSASETPIVEAASTPEVSAPATPADATAPATLITEPDPRLLVGRYPVRKYTDIRHKIAQKETLYSLIRVYGDRIFPKKYRQWQELAQYNNIRPPHYILKPGEVFLIPTLAHIVLPKTGYETELKQIQSELAKQPSDPELLNQRAVIHFKRNELNQARLTLRRGVKSSPKNGMLHNNLGFIYMIIEDGERAQNEFELAITHSEKPAIPHCNLGVLHMSMKKFDLAIKAFESALAVDANLLDAKYNLALAHEKIGNIESAREHLRGLAQLLSDDAEVASALERLTLPQVTGE